MTATDQRSPPPALSPAFSVYLDAFRLLAALVVVLDHTRNFVMPRAAVLAPMDGREAVVAFFVLSGLVVAYATEARERDWRAYVTARVARIYPVAVACLLVTLGADALGGILDPAHRAFLNEGLGGFLQPANLWSAVRSLTFTNQLWFGHVVFGSAEPYWSLGYEVPYYVLFGLVVFAPARLRLGLVLVWALVCGPRIVAALPIWLMGVAVWKLVAARRFVPSSVGWLCALAPIPVVVAFRLWLGPDVGNLARAGSPSQELITMSYFAVIGVCVAAHLYGVASLLERRPAVDPRVADPIRWLAGGSFTLYLVHQPLLILVSGFVFEASRPVQAAALVAVFWAAYGIAEIAERPKRTYARLVDRLLWSDRARPAVPAPTSKQEGRPETGRPPAIATNTAADQASRPTFQPNR